jgi:hypothetical protein
MGGAKTRRFPKNKKRALPKAKPNFSRTISPVNNALFSVEAIKNQYASEWRLLIQVNFKKKVDE